MAFLNLFIAWFWVEFRIKCIEISAVQMILNDTKTFTETLIVDDFTFSQKADGIADIRIFVYG